MLDWISDTIMAIVTAVPAIFVEQESPNFPLIRAMFGLILIAVIVSVIAMTPFRSAIAHFAARCLAFSAGGNNLEPANHSAHQTRAAAVAGKSCRKGCFWYREP